MLGKWRVAGVPHKGWACVGVEDDGSPPDFVCEMCETAEIRYVHEMEHPDYPGPLHVGCVCAGNMEEDLVGARRREADFKGRRSKRNRFLIGAWKTSARGNEYKTTRDGSHVVVFPGDDGWRAVITDAFGHKSWPNGVYPTQDAAKLAAYEQLEANHQAWKQADQNARMRAMSALYT